MLNQEVSVDVWKMAKGMVTYAALSLAGWVLFRFFTNVICMPRRLRTQQERIQESLAEFQKRYPDLKLTEEELIEAYKRMDEEDKIFEKEKKDGEKKEEEEENKKSK